MRSWGGDERPVWRLATAAWAGGGWLGDLWEGGESYHGLGMGKGHRPRTNTIQVKLGHQNQL